MRLFGVWAITVDITHSLLQYISAFGLLCIM